MRILVCVKQVPDTAEIKIDPVTNTLIRAGVPSIVNPFDACALEVAARIKDANPSGEWGGAPRCVGVGSVDCPIADVKVYAVGGPYSLEESY